MKILITGAAGFIGSHLSQYLMEKNYDIVCLDNFSEVSCKEYKIRRLNALCPSVDIINIDVKDTELMMNEFYMHRPDVVVHLAAYPGVRTSIDTPQAHISNNIMAHQAAIECSRKLGTVKLFLYASSSSVYGGSVASSSLSESCNLDSKGSSYAVSKHCCELISENYYSNYNLNQVGLRLFSVYGSWGRPDMAYWIFAKNTLEGLKTDLYNKGEMFRNLTHVNDVVCSIEKIIRHELKNDNCMHEIYNLGSSASISMKKLMELTEDNLKIKSNYNLIKNLHNESESINPNLEKIKNKYNISCKTNSYDGVPKFLSWFSNSYEEVKGAF